MSAKWRRIKRWDDRTLTGPWLPVKWLLRALSSIRLAVILLTSVALYGALASVPIGLIALAPTWILIGLSAALAVAAAAAALGWLGRLAVPATRRGWRFSAAVLGGLAGSVLAGWAWAAVVWPRLAYHPPVGPTPARGLRLFADFVSAHQSTTLRRLPGIELTELEFYSAWPLRVILLLFVVNMVVATLRRIEFNRKNLGVLTVHGGIVVIALASVYYQRFKLEGDTILLAGQAPAGSVPGLGPAQPVFYDSTRVVLYAQQAGRRDALGSPVLEQRPIQGLPRYNAYGLDAGQAPHTWLGDIDAPGPDLQPDPQPDAKPDAKPDTSPDRGRSLSIDLPPRVDPRRGGLDSDISLRVVGYAPYAEPIVDLRLYPRDRADSIPPGSPIRPLRRIELIFAPEVGGGDRFAFSLMPDWPARRWSANPLMSFEVTRGLDPSRWRDLTTDIPAGVDHALAIELPGAGPEGQPLRVIAPATPGDVYQVGSSGWSVAVKSLEPEPPFPIITEGYEGATSSVAILRITPPTGQPFDRWVYSRFPEISQDLLDGPIDGGDGAPAPPLRRDADPAIRVGYLDLGQRLIVHADELTGPGDPEPVWRVAVRGLDGSVRVVEGVRDGSVIEGVIPRIDLAFGAGWAHAEPGVRPGVVEDAQRDKRFVGTHDRAMVAVEVSLPRDPSGLTQGPWRRVEWIEFTKYLGVGAQEPWRSVALPDGRRIELGFGRLQRPFPGFALRLVDFEMIAYDHRGSPRDFQSLIRVEPRGSADAARFSAYERVAKLNAPLRAPFVWDDARPALANAALTLTGGLNPEQFKISQAGWDQTGWLRTQALADQGLIQEPFAQFTIMQVGNNPGIHLIAVGGAMVALGIPWAFYVKPWLLRRERSRLAQSVIAGSVANESRTDESGTDGSGSRGNSGNTDGNGATGVLTA